MFQGLPYYLLSSIKADVLHLPATIRATQRICLIDLLIHSLHCLDNGVHLTVFCSFDKSLLMGDPNFLSIFCCIFACITSPFFSRFPIKPFIWSKFVLLYERYLAIYIHRTGLSSSLYFSKTSLFLPCFSLQYLLPFSLPAPFLRFIFSPKQNILFAILGAAISNFN